MGLISRVSSRTYRSPSVSKTPKIKFLTMETERRYDRRRSRSRSNRRRSYSRSPSYRDKYRSHKSHKSKSRKHSRSSRRSRTPPRKRIIGKKIFFTPSPERKKKRRVKSEMLFDPEAGF